MAYTKMALAPVFDAVSEFFLQVSFLANVMGAVHGFTGLQFRHVHSRAC